MNRRSMILVAALAVLFACETASAAEPKLEGVWTWQRFVEGRPGEAKFTLKFQRQNNRLTGQLSGPYGQAQVRELKVDAAGTATWSVDFTIQGKKTTYKYTGTVDGDDMRLEEVRQDPETLSSVTQHLGARRQR